MVSSSLVSLDRVEACSGRTRNKPRERLEEERRVGGMKRGWMLGGWAAVRVVEGR